MTLPLIGFVSLQGVILGLVLLLLCVYGYFAGLNRMLGSLFVSIIAMSIAVIPQFHGWASEGISLIFARQSRYAAYLIIFVVAFFSLRFLFRRLPRLVNLGLPPQADRVCGIFAGLINGFVACTMLLIFIYGWRLPLDGLYARSSLGAFICKIWAQTAVLPELHSILYVNPITLI